MINLPNREIFIGISGVATSGKDSLYLTLDKILGSIGIETEKFALADELKTQLNEFCVRNYNISTYTTNPKEKELIRPMLVEHGRVKRRLTQGKYWTGLLTPKIKDSLKEGVVSICTDVRYDEYPEDELFWCKRIMGGELIHVTRLMENGKPVLPPNKDEQDNDPKIKAKADYHLVWQTTSDKSLMLDFVKLQLKQLLDKICQAYQKPPILI